MITQCEIRKLYSQKNEPGISEAIDLAKTLERRRCGHHPEDYPEPLSTEECFQTVVDPKSTGQNKHRYVVASQAQDVRRMLRAVRGVPLIYIKRSVMILEPMADESVQVRAREERSKFRAEIKNALGKRKRAEDDDEGSEDEKAGKESATNGTDEKSKKKKGHGPKGPNPLAVKKSKKPSQPKSADKKDTSAIEQSGAAETAPAKRKRRRKAKAQDSTVESGQSQETKVSRVTESLDDN